jgi:hypothetical protein
VAIVSIWEGCGLPVQVGRLSVRAEGGLRDVQRLARMSRARGRQTASTPSTVPAPCHPGQVGALVTVLLTPGFTDIDLETTTVRFWVTLMTSSTYTRHLNTTAGF